MIDNDVNGATPLPHQKADNILVSSQDCPWECLLTPITPEAPSGEFLYYTPLYDQIRLAREEEDGAISWGIWERPLKKADWTTVETLCTQALQTQSKDLQLAGWLTEAWITLYGLQGLGAGLQLIIQMSHAFWPTLYPILDLSKEGADAEERRGHFYEWLDEALYRRLVQWPLIKDQKGALTLAQWQHAIRLNSVSKRVGSAVDEQEFTLEQLDQRLSKKFQADPHDNSPKEWGHLWEGFEQGLGIYEQLKKELDRLFQASQRPAMNQLSDGLEEGKRLLLQYKPASFFQGRDSQDGSSPKKEDFFSQGAPSLDLSPLLLPNQEITTSASSLLPSDFLTPLSSYPPLSTRENAYQWLREIAEFLKKTDPHSLVPNLLLHLIEWEKKTALEMFQDIAQSAKDNHPAGLLFSQLLKKKEE